MGIASISAIRITVGLSQPVFATTPPQDASRLFIVERTGRIKNLDLATGTTNVFLDLSGQVSTIGEEGLLGLAFDPAYAANGYFDVYLTNVNGDTEVRRYQVSSGDPNQADAASGTLIITIDQPDDHHNHKGGWIGFGPKDGYLYVALGDGGIDTNAQDTTSLLGKILRLDVHTDDYAADAARNYSIPSDNPFVAAADASPEIWALGLRNPFRAGFDRTSGELYIGDVGEEAFEEIDLGQPGGNYGWSILEGPKLREPGPLGPGIATSPIYFYDRTVGETVIGGYVYRGPDAGLQGLYFFADYIEGKIFTLENQDSAWVSTDRTDQVMPNLGEIGSPVSFGEDASGNLYIVDLDGEIFRLNSEPVQQNIAQPIGFDFQDVTLSNSATGSSDISINSLNDSSTVGSDGTALAMDLELSKMWNDSGDIGGCGDGCL